MPLRTYRKKRRFTVTPEPRGSPARAGGRAFVIQKHAARRLHYDLRLELDGVMKSWAVTRGPSLVPGEKRLAVHVEDHPVEYNAFEGTIPKGEYGGGTVMIWDRGAWVPEGDPHRGYEKGHLDFRLEGEKLRGGWHLVRMRRRAGERQDPWLLIKARDEAARSPRDPDILEEQPLSAASGRSMDQIAGESGRKAVWHSNAPKPAAKPAAKKPAPRPRKRETRTVAEKAPVAARRSGRTSEPGKAPAAGARRAPLPAFLPPCLAVPSATPPDSDGWLHEVKFDGYRMQARLDNGAVRLFTRTGLDWTKRFRPVAEALRALPARAALIDSEIVAHDAEGQPSFSALQEALKKGNGAFVGYAFDLMHLDGWDLTGAPLAARKQALRDLLGALPSKGQVQFSDHFEEKGSLLLSPACRLKLEGIVSKRADAPYRSGRTGDWIKTKCAERQEFVAIGYAPATDDARAVGALILGYYENGTLRYAGRVGTGFTQAGARDLWRRLAPMRAKRAPVTPIPEEERRRPHVWIEPRIVVEVEFQGWTHGGRLRHPSFKGVREDKRPRDVIREEPAMAAAAPATKGKATRRSAAAIDEPPNGVRLTNPDRVYWEDVGLTKQGLADYYTQVWDWIAPHVTGRVLSLVRCPEGTSKACFFQKHASAGLDSGHLRLIPEEGDQVIAIDSLAGLLSLVQAGVLEIHVRGSTVERLDAADRIVFDLDPGSGVAWPEMVRAAREVGKRLAGMGLATFLKATGGKGLHVVVPIAPTAWDEVKAFSRAFARALAADSPERYVAVASKKARVGRVFIDYLRNSREATAICPFSTRARAGAPVAAPIAWSELGSLKAPNRYTVANLVQRLTRLKRDPWAGIGDVAQQLPRSGRR